MEIDPKFIELQKHTHNNEIEILHSKTCSCVFCRQHYDARNVNDWVNDEYGLSAICPECGMDAVIGDNGGTPIDKETLKAMNLAFYGEDYMAKHPEAAKKYVERYKEGKITHKKTNESLYIQYLSFLSTLGDSDAAYSLGELYEFGTEFTEKDPKTAFSYYASSPLKDDGDALARLGVLSASGALGKVDASGAYQAFAKGMAMGSLNALIYFSDCYRDGIGTNPDKEFAFCILSSIWEESYQRFTLSLGKDTNIFPALCLRLAKAYRYGDGVQKDDNSAMRFYLLADFGYQRKEESHSFTKEDKEDAIFCSLEIERIAKALNINHQDPIFDSSTFAASTLSLGSSPSPLLRMEFVPGEFHEDEHWVEFDIKYNFPPLIVDVGSLFCKFVPDKIHWTFDDVSSWNIGEKHIFNRFSGDFESGLNFIYDLGGEPEVIASFSFNNDKTSSEQVPEKTEKGDMKA